MCWRVENGERYLQLHRRCHESKSRERVRGYFQNSRRTTSNDRARSSVRGMLQRKESETCEYEPESKRASAHQQRESHGEISNALLQKTPFWRKQMAGGIVGHNMVTGKQSFEIKVFNENADGRHETLNYRTLNQQTTGTTRAEVGGDLLTIVGG